MYKKGRPITPHQANLELYVEKMSKKMLPLLKKHISVKNAPFVNTRELDDDMCERMKDNLTLIDGKNRWIEIHKNMRVRIITTTLMSKLGYTMWSGNTRKVLCKPKNEFKRASELKNKD